MLRKRVLPVPVVKMSFLSNVDHFFGIRSALWDLRFTNLTHIIQTALKLEVLEEDSGLQSLEEN